MAKIDAPSSEVDEPSWPADKVERRPVESLIPYARNARTHSDEQISQIAASSITGLLKQHLLKQRNSVSIRWRFWRGLECFVNDKWQHYIR